MAEKNYVIIGTVHHVGDTVQVSESFKKRELVIKVEENPQYPEYIKVDAVQQNVYMLEELQFGDKVEAHFNLRGREFTSITGGKQFFNQIVLWRLKSWSQGGKKDQAPEDIGKPADISAATGEDDLPF